jgi:hypothetical protein
MTDEPRRPDLDRLRRVSSYAALGILIVVFLILIVLCFLTARTTDDASLSIAIFMAAMLLGWLTGFLLSPGTAREEARFGAAAKAISAFASGFLLAKLDNLLNALLAPKMVVEASSVLPAFRITIALSGFAGTVIYMYIARTYLLEWLPGPDNSTAKA